MIHQTQLEVMVEQLNKQRQYNNIDGKRFMLLCERQGVVAEMMILNEFSKNLNSNNSSQEAELVSELTQKLIKLSGKIIRINRKLDTYNY